MNRQRPTAHFYFVTALWVGICLLILPACKVTPQDPIEKFRSVLSLNEELTLTIVSDTSSKQAFCITTNTLVIQKSFPGNRDVFCKESSRLDPDISPGLTCEGGVMVKAPQGISSQPKKCGTGTAFSLCGVPATKSAVIGKRADGGSIEELTFTNLPWGCRVQLEASLDSTFTKGGTPKLDLLIRPPECPFCPTKNIKTCGVCPSLGTTSLLKAGQVFKNCTGNSCKACPILNGTGTVEHGEGKVYYQKTTSACGEKCSAQSLLRICNDGLWEGDPSYAYPQCTDTLCGCKLPNKPITYNHNSTVSIFKSEKPPCGVNCEKLELVCDDSKWKTASLPTRVLTEAELIGYPFLNCTKNFCTCTRPQKDTLAHQQTKTVFSKQEVACSEACSSVSATLTCNDGRIEPSVPGAETFFDSCRVGSCGCTFTDATGNTVILPNGATKIISKEASPACGKACETLTIKCDNTVMKKEVNTVWEPLTPTDIATYRNSQPCQKRPCDCQVLSPDGQTTVIPFNETREFFYPNPKETNCDPLACDKNKRKLTCAPLGTTASQIRTDRGETGGSWSPSCEVALCGCKVPFGGTIEHGKKFRAFKFDKATCATQSLCDESQLVTCNNGVLTNYDALTFKHPNCAPPICECKHPALTVQVGQSARFFQKETVVLGESCNRLSQVFSCAEGAVWKEPGIDQYGFASCVDAKLDDGTGGGTGGGGGNDEGAGWGFRQRLGLMDSSPTLGSQTTCTSASNCFKYAFHGKSERLHRQSCVLPWGRGEAEFYTEVAAFDSPCVTKPDKCSKHRMVRMCHVSGWTGEPKYNSPTCEEKEVCP